MAAVMEDEELRRKLKEFGEDVAVTDSTRAFLTSRLRRLSQQPSSRAINDSRGRSLLNFSSDESESDSSRASGVGSGIASAILGNASNVTERRTRRSSRSSNQAKSPGWNDDHFVQPRNPLRRSVTSIVDSRTTASSSRSSAAAAASALSGAMTPTRHHQQQRRSQAINSPSPSLTQFRALSGIRKYKRGSSESNLDNSGSDSDVSDSSISNIPENTGVDEFPTSRRSIVTATVSPSSVGVSLRESPRRGGRREDSSTSIVGETSDAIPLINGHHGLLEEEEEDETEAEVNLNTSSFASTASDSALKNHSQCISMILLITLAFFFCVIGFIYLRYRDQVPYNALANTSDSTCMAEDGTICGDQLPTATEVAEQLKSTLQILRGEAECGSVSTARLSIEEARTTIRQLAKGVSVGLNDVLSIFDKNKGWGIKFFDFSGDETDTSNPSLIWWLESSVANLPWSCKLRKAWHNTIYKVSVGLSVGLLVVAASAAVYYWRERAKAKQQEIYTLVEKILESLQNNYNADNTLDPYTPIPHVRDRLIPPAERSTKRGIWDAAVKFIQENESRVRQEVRMIKGEDIPVWHWLPADRSPMAGRSRSGRLWQGQAFENLDTGVNALPYSPTQCLKVRNMFDPETEIEDNWTVHIRDEIIEKCAGCDIVHIRVDESHQGCVYIKCKDEITAGKVYKHLHGSWFDGKLVTVKYLRLERYHERFPDAIGCSKALKASAPLFGLGLNHSNAAATTSNN